MRSSSLRDIKATVGHFIFP